MLYSRPQLALLLLLAAALLAGFAVREWRAGFPDAAAWLEAFDQDGATAGPGAVPLAAPSRASRPPPAAALSAPAVRAPRAERSVPEGGGNDPRPLDLNEATVEQLARLPGVGPSLARRIVEERERRGRFAGPEGLRAVLGMGPRKLAALRDLVSAAP